MSSKVRAFLGATVVCVSLAAPAAADAKRCGRVKLAHGAAKVRIVHGHVGCGAARSEIKAAFKAEASRHWDGFGRDGIFWKVRGWRCFVGLGATETFCHRGRLQVDGSTRSDDGWWF